MAATEDIHVNWHSVERSEAGPHLLDMSHAHTPPVVGDIVGQRGTVVCLAKAQLSDVVDLLILHDRTAAGVVDEQGGLVGVATENDLVLAYACGESAKATVGAWLASGRARLPASELPEMTVRPSTTLLEAAVRMRAHVHSEHACHHLIVYGDDGTFHGILSSLDLARALCGMGVESETLEKVRAMSVLKIMKHRAELPTCSHSDTLGDALWKMARVHQNCVLVTHGGANKAQALGIVTPRDALRAFIEHVPLKTDLGHWLRGLQQKWEPRQIRMNDLVLDAAVAMATGFVHHLVVVSPLSGEVVGAVSSLDMARALAAEEDIFAA
mmetsp:Transcript_52810/g.141434  ORF Transcript_52810/g.141434 Transcript_52810/m.141434 type:complete len:326 (-) Transcript_52810:113-1090(-)